MKLKEYKEQCEKNYNEINQGIYVVLVFLAKLCHDFKSMRSVTSIRSGNVKIFIKLISLITTFVYKHVI